ncbi:MAG: PBP1b-binding outer membrane lipoprotein LpoB [Saprospiraceae bacterium]|jgi:PBP1b-binding outer membrane lipoprotein LpoB
MNQMTKLKVISISLLLFLSMLLLIGCPSEDSNNNVQDYETTETEDADNPDDYEEYFSIEDSMYTEEDSDEELEEEMEE